MKKLCLQIGLCESAEGLYLVKRDLQVLENHPHELPPIPYHRFTGDWRFIGVDADLLSILYLSEKYPPNEKIKFVLGGVGAKNELRESLIGWRVNGTITGRRQKRFNIKKENKCFIQFYTLQSLCRALNITKIDLLIVDIEGFEVPVFSNYDFSIDIDFIFIETHIKGKQFRDASASESDLPLLEQEKAYMKNLILPQGYVLEDIDHKDTSEYLFFTKEELAQ